MDFTNFLLNEKGDTIKKYIGNSGNVVVPEGITTLGKQSFFMTPIREIALPEGLKYIEEQCFWNCHALTKVALPDTLKTIEKEAFRNCGSLFEITLPKSLTKIASGAFYKAALKKVYYKGTKAEWDKIQMEDGVIEAIGGNESFSNRSFLAPIVEFVGEASASHNTVKIETEIQFTASLKNYNLSQGYEEYFYKQTGAYKGSLEICCACFDEMSEEERSEYTQSAQDPYGMVDFVNRTKDGNHYSCGKIAQKLLEGYKQIKECALMHFWGNRFIQTKEMTGCLGYFSYLYEHRISDRRALRCYRAIMQYGDEEKQRLASMINFILRLDSEGEVNIEEIFENLDEETVNQGLRTAEANKELENYVFLYAAKKWAGYTIEKCEQQTCEQFCVEMGMPNIYNILENGQKFYAVDAKDECAIIDECIGICNYNEWREFWMMLYYLYIKTYSNADFTFCNPIFNTIQARKWYAEQWKDLAVVMVLKHHACKKNGDLHGQENAERVYGQLVEYAKSEGTYKDFPLLDSMPSDGVVNKSIFYGTLGNLFDHNKPASKPKIKIQLEALTEKPVVKELEAALRVAKENDKYGAYIYLFYLLMRQNVKLNFEELAQVCVAAKVSFLSEYKTIQDKKIPQSSLTYKGVPEEKKHMLQYVMELYSEESFEGWQEFWVKVFYEFACKELKGCLYPFAEKMVGIFKARDDKYPKYDTYNSEAYSLVHCLIETSAYIGDEAKNKAYTENLQNMQRQLLLATGNIFNQMTEEEMSSCLYNAVYFDAKVLEELDRLGTCVKKGANGYAFELQFQNGEETSRGTLVYNHTISLEMEGDVEEVEVPEMDIVGTSNMIRGGIFATLSGNSTSIEMEGCVSIDGEEKGFFIDAVIDVPYNKISGNASVEVEVNSFKRRGKYITLDVDFIFTLSDEEDDDEEEEGVLSFGGRVNLWGNSQDDDNEEVLDIFDDSDDDYDEDEDYEDEWEGVTTYDGKCSVFVKIPGTTGYFYNYDGKISVGDRVYVSGKLAGKIGVVDRIAAWDDAPYMQKVARIIKEPTSSTSATSTYTTSTRTFNSTNSSYGQSSVSPQRTTGGTYSSTSYQYSGINTKNTNTSNNSSFTPSKEEKRKKKIGFIVFGIIIAVALLVAIIGTAINEKQLNTIPSTPTNLHIEGDTLYWDEVDGADWYHVKIGNREYDAFRNSYELPFNNGDTYEVSVCAYDCDKNDGKEESLYSSTITYTPKSYSITYNNYNPEETKKVVKYEPESYVNMPYKMGATFGYGTDRQYFWGWYTDSACTTPFDEGDYRFKINRNIVLYGKWADYYLDVENGILKSAYFTNSQLTIPSNVTAINEKVFKDNQALTELVIGANVEIIGANAFAGCSNLSKVTFTGNNLRKLENNAFAGCSSLTEIVLPDSLKTIGVGAFRNCTALTKVNFPNQLTAIGDQAFYNCSQLTEAILPSSVEEIESWAFHDCTSLVKISIPVLNTSIKSLFGGSSYSYSLKQADFAPALREVEILSPCSSVGMDFFQYCDLLTKVVIPNSVVSIAANAFTDCDNATICTPLSSAPSGWNSKWNNNNCPVVWGYSGTSKTYKFVTNGGTAVDSITTDMLTVLPITTKEGAEFAGWYEDSAFSGSPITAPYTGDKTTLYAKWIVRDGRSFDTAYIIDAGTSYSSYWSYSCTATGTMYFQFTIPTRYSSLEIFSIDVFGYNDYYQNFSYAVYNSNKNVVSYTVSQGHYTVSGGSTYYIVVYATAGKDVSVSIQDY